MKVRVRVRVRARILPVDDPSVRSLGQTLDGLGLDWVGVGHGPLHAWVVHRQHPGPNPNPQP